MANTAHNTLTGADLHITKAHKDSHVDGTDDIQDATSGQKGLATATQITKLDGVETSATKYPDTGEQAFLDADHTKLDGIETGATKYPGTGEQAFLDADHTKLNGIETSATADQTNAEIKTAIEAASTLTLASSMIFDTNQINRVTGDVDDAELRINYKGYNNGTTRFRDFYVSNGKNGTIIFVDGSTNETTFYGNLLTAHSVDGRDVSVDGTKLDGIDSGADVTDTVLAGAPPAAANSTGTTGQIRSDASYIYVCVATNTWERVAIASW